MCAMSDIIVEADDKFTHTDGTHPGCRWQIFTITTGHHTHDNHRHDLCLEMTKNCHNVHPWSLSLLSGTWRHQLNCFKKLNWKLSVRLEMRVLVTAVHHPSPQQRHNVRSSDDLLCSDTPHHLTLYSLTTLLILETTILTDPAWLLRLTGAADPGK